jgi:hypothetical protein
MASAMGTDDARTPTTNRPPHLTQRVVEKVGRSITNSETPQLALWDYAERSAAWALGQTTGDPLAEQIHAALTRSPDGLTRTQIRDLCQRNLPTDRVEQALNTLAAAGRAQRQRTLTGGRPAEHWTAAAPPTA